MYYSVELTRLAVYYSGVSLALTVYYLDGDGHREHLLKQVSPSKGDPLKK